jgi:hypothetical protein
MRPSVDGWPFQLQFCHVEWAIFIRKGDSTLNDLLITYFSGALSINSKDDEQLRTG